MESLNNHSTSIHPPLVSLVGAGPGDPELLTIKAWKTLQSADVVLYDALVDPSVLAHAPAAAPTLYVGKRKGCKTNKQEAINELLVHCARKYGHVVRLKGGDPFVFGRGQEEIEFVEKHGIQTAYIPGISSSISVPGLLGIPVTHRGTNESFWVTTGTLSDGSLSKDIPLAAQSSATVVILMGSQKLEEIIGVFTSYGKENLPMAVIEKGSTPEQHIHTATVRRMSETLSMKKIQMPAIIVMGEVVKKSPYWNIESVATENKYNYAN